MYVKMLTNRFAFGSSRRPQHMLFYRCLRSYSAAGVSFTYAEVIRSISSQCGVLLDSYPKPQDFADHVELSWFCVSCGFNPRCLNFMKRTGAGGIIIGFSGAGQVCQLI